MRTVASVKASATTHPTVRQRFDLTLGPGVTGLVGRNGSGKSTLLNFIAGRVGAPLVTGTCTCSHPVRLLDQQAALSMRLMDLFGVTEPLLDLWRALRGEATKAAFEAIDWTLEERLLVQLDRFGLSDVELNRRLGTLSGGQQLRARLAALFFDAPEIVLLDEPTNALDRDGQAMVAQALRDHSRIHGGIACVASHDRHLLDQMDRIVSLDPDGGVTVFGGGWTAFAAARDADLARLEQASTRMQRQEKQTEAKRRESAARQDRRARQGRKLRDGSQSKMLLDKAKEGAQNSASGRIMAEARKKAALEGERAEIAQKIEVKTPVHMDFPAVHLPPTKQILQLGDAVFAVGGQHIGPINLSMVGPARLRVSGPNGAGKSTLLRAISGEIAPMSGQVNRLVPCAMLDQNGGFDQDTGSLIAAAEQAFPSVAEAQLRACLARAGFRGDAAHAPVQELSGGEKMRARIALLAASPEVPPLLLLDEPTNHLDLAALETLELGLSQWRGAMIVVTHDDVFAQKMAFTDVISGPFA
ncbi:ATP-binding cassette domain-containing protein [Roseobacter sp. TSBP12]|uniref:ATP-binding cassette domain-containing protein n=1 Tax=Roseobacter sp. TSBP12 TaxID=1236613 RepID=UPI00186A64B2|nr:ATP-binding cassette domain-containing protein [Roseobacter sp. TSBP12]